MNCRYFTPISSHLPEAEQQARAKRQRHAEWGLAVARLGGTEPTAALLAELQLYIDGQVSLQTLCQQSPEASPADHVYQAVARREQFAS
jgi:hypothetical protein